jgi:dicarboxylate transporter DctA-like protein
MTRLAGRTGKISLTFAIALLAAVLLGLLLSPIAIERMVRSELAKRGIDVVEMDLSTPGLGGIAARDVAIGADKSFTAQAVAIDYSIPGLLDRQIERVRLVRPRLRLSIGGDGRISFGSLDPLLAGGEGGGGGVPAPVEIVDGTITATTPAGEMTATLDGAVTLEAGAGPLKLSIAGPWLTAGLELRVHHNGSALALSGRVTEAKITHPLLSASLSGPFTAAFGGEKPTATAELTIAGLNSPVLTIGGGVATGNLSAWYEPGRIAGDLRLAGAGGRLEASLLEDPASALHMVIQGNGLAVPEWLAEARLNAAMDLDPARREAVLVEAARIEGRLAPELRASIPASLAPAFGDAPLILTAERGLKIAQASSGSSLAGKVALSQQGGATLALDGTVVSAEQGVSGAVQARLDAATLKLADALIRKLSLAAPLAIDAEDGRTLIRLTGPAPLSAASIDLGATRVTGLETPLQPADAPLLALGPDGVDFALSSGAGKLSGRAGQARQPFAISWANAAIQGRPGASMLANISGGRVALPDIGWEASGLSARLTADETQQKPPAIKLSVDRLAQSGKEPVLAPVALSGTVLPSDTELRFDLKATALGGQVQARATGAHDLARGRGSAKLALEPLTFAPGGLQPAALIPRLGDTVRDASGILKVSGPISWSEKGLASELDLALESIGFVGPAGPVLGLNGNVRLDGLAPLSTPPGQRITVAAVQAAVPISDLALRFALRDGRLLDIEDARLVLAGGRVAVAPVTLDADAKRNRIVLEVAEVQLPILFDLIGLDGLTGTGRLAGEVPVLFEAGDLAVEDGKLESEEPGQIRYDPAQKPAALQGGGESIGLALAALRNFHYDRLTLNLDREIGGETLVGLHIAGKNPDFYGGYPVEFNLNLSGKLDQILVQGLAGYRIPETLQDQLKQPPQGSSPSAE